MTRAPIATRATRSRAGHATAPRSQARQAPWALLAALLLSACRDAGTPTSVVEGSCVVPSGGPAPELLRQIDCSNDFQALASDPLDATLPGARSVKVVFDRADGEALYFQNSQLYPIHYQFASTHLSGGKLPLVPSLAVFNASAYFSPERRFLLGAVTRYDGPQRWVLELAPYDTATAAMITALYQAVRRATFFGPVLAFHPTSDAVAATARELPAELPQVSTDELFAAIDYQPLTLGSAIGRLRFVTAASLAGEYLSYQDLVVLDQAPNDISVVQGLITQEFQTPLSHVNVLSKNRGTPNMGLRAAMSDPQLRALEGRLVELKVGALTYSVREVSEADAQAFWEAHKPTPVVLPAANLSITDLVDLENVTAEPSDGVTLREAIKEAVRAFGGKAAQYSVLARLKGVPTRTAFAIPVYYYHQFMEQNGFYARLRALLADPQFVADYRVRDEQLALLRAAMLQAPLDSGFEARLAAKLARDYPGLSIRFRTSTNSEDLEGFPCAGCYESHTGDPADWEDVRQAIRETYASVWLFRTFEERNYYSVAHESVTMALLVHHNFPDEEANGVAVTANPFDPSGLDPAFYINVQAGGSAEVVHPPAGVKSDELLYYYGEPNQPISYLTHSSLIPAGTTVLTTAQVHQLGAALAAIHSRFSLAFGAGAGQTGWYAMDVEFKFDDEATPGQSSTLYIKQARPYPPPAAR